MLELLLLMLAIGSPVIVIVIIVHCFPCKADSNYELKAMERQS